MQRFAFTMRAASFILCVGSALAGAQTRCSVDDLEDYYGEALDEEYKISREALAIAEGLFRGPLMKDGRRAEVASFRNRFVAGRDIELRDLQELVRQHLFGESKEYSDLFERLRRDDGDAKAAARIRDSIYSAYGFEPKRAADKSFDSCLIAAGQTHIVVTRAIVELMERKNLD